MLDRCSTRLAIVLRATFNSGLNKGLGYWKWNELQGTVAI